MAEIRSPYPPEVHERMIGLVRAGRTPDKLAKEFELSARRRSARSDQVRFLVSRPRPRTPGAGFIEAWYNSNRSRP